LRVRRDPPGLLRDGAPRLPAVIWTKNRGRRQTPGVTVDLRPLVDHHSHGLVVDDLDRAGFEALMNEAAWPSPLGTTLFDSMLGLAIRRPCAPVLDLEPLATADAYLARRTALGCTEVNRRMVVASGIEQLLVDTGLTPETVCPTAQH